jgi:aminoglycoside 3-N-acetyltransferase
VSVVNSSPIINELSDIWRKCGIKSGDTVLLHSDVKRILMFYNYFNQPNDIKKEKVLSVDDILDSFFLALGGNGTLVIPLFNFDFSEGKLFDINVTPSQMGVLTEVARNRLNYIRTKNPVYSFAIFGKNKQYFQSVKLETAMGVDSVFSRLMEMGGKIAVLGLTDRECMTFYHHIEEMNRVDYRIPKKFTGLYIDSQNNTTEKTINLYVRDLDKGVNTLLDPVADLMWEEGLYSGERHNEGTGLRVVSANKMYDFVSDLIKSNKTKGFLYEIK